MVEHVPGEEEVPAAIDVLERVRVDGEDLIRGEVDAEITDFDDLWYAEERTAVDGWLRDRGWDVATATFSELMARYDRRIPQGAEESMPPTLYVSAQRRER